MKKLIFLLAIAGGAYWLWFLPPRTVTHPAGILVKQEPLQEPVNVRPWQQGDYTITALASFRIRARVLSKTSYHMDREADLSPIDLALGWQEMSDSDVLNEVEVSQSNRWYYYHYQNVSISPDLIPLKSANMHMIPQTPAIRDQLSSVAIGDIVNIQGYLVRISAKDGWEWSSSMSRNDTGNHSCEVIWVQNMSVDSL
jgi:hypothetical protein